MIINKRAILPAVLLASLLAAAGAAQAGNWPTFAGSAQRLGVVTDETTLTPATVAGLKQHWHAAIHSQSLSQPLYIRNVATANGTHAEVYQTSLAGSIFAFNAQTGALDWSVALPNYTPSCAGGPIGVNDTPTIDTIKKLLYVVDGAGNLHALALGTGAEATGYPVQVIDTTNRNAGSYTRGSPTKTGNLLYLVTSGGGNCEAATSPYHGAVIEFNTLIRKVTHTYFPVGNDPAQQGGGIWGVGGVLAEPKGSAVYTATGNTLTGDKNQLDGESVVSLDNTLAKTGIDHPPLDPGGDYDFGSTPTAIDATGCPPLLSVMNKTGELYIYQRNAISSGPVQVLNVSAGGGASAFIGMTAYDPAKQLLFVDNPVGSADGTFTHGLIALQLTAACRFTVGWQTTFGTGVFTHNTRSTDPTIAGGIVWVVTGGGDSFAAFDETNGTVLWTSGTQLSSTTSTPVTVADGQVFVQSGSGLYAYGL